MSGANTNNKVERFLQNRSRPNIFTHQHQVAASGVAQDQSLRRSAIAANVRVPTPVTRLQTPVPSGTRLKTTPVQDHNPNIGSNERPNELRRAQTEATHGRQQASGDIFDTDIDDITDSLFTERIPAEEGQRKEQQQQQQSSRSATQEQEQEDTSDVQDEEEEQEDSSDGSSSSEMQPADDPTVTFTPEQAARVQDYGRRALQLSEKPKTEAQPAAQNGTAQTRPEKNLYDITGPDFQRADRQATRPVAERTVPVLYQADSHGAKDGSGKASRVSVPQPMTSGSGLRAEQRELPLEPSNATRRGEEEVTQQRQAVSGADLPSPGARIASPTDIGTPNSASELDYPPDILAGMTYEELLCQPFDTNPSPPPSVLPPNHSTSSIPSQLAHVLNLPSNQQRQYFASLTASQWEDCGDWFVEQFTDITGKMREARKQKRKVAMAFEEEIAAREKVVRSKTEGFDNVLEGMKRGGQGLLGRQTF
ncbi:MAG: hypothetical protein M1816_000117 [Peltula sp. TS41687]|nr:MAG: hypothetical protein M1816_000117 [Peltula sp. TS41687]